MHAGIGQWARSVAANEEVAAQETLLRFVQAFESEIFVSTPPSHRRTDATGAERFSSGWRVAGSVRYQPSTGSGSRRAPMAYGTAADAAAASASRNGGHSGDRIASRPFRVLRIENSCRFRNTWC